MQNSKEYKNLLTCLTTINDTEKLSSALKEGRKLFEIVGFTPEQMTTFWGAISDMIEDREYQNALDALVFLTAIDPDNSELWATQADIYEQLHDYEAAMSAQQTAILSDPKNLEHYMEAIGLSVRAKEFDHARAYIETIKEMAEHIEDQDLAQQFRDGAEVVTELVIIASQ